MIKNILSNRQTMMLFVLIVGSLGIVPAHASAMTLQTYGNRGNCDKIDWPAMQPTVSLQSPFDGQEFKAGEKIYVTGYTTYGGCANSPQDLNITVTGPDGSNLTKTEHSGIRGGHKPWTSGMSFAIGPFTVPSTNGDYAITVNVNNAITGYGVRASNGRKVNYLCNSGRILKIIIHVKGGLVTTTGTGTTTTSTGNTTLTRQCTPGVDCPDTDLGKIITKARLGSSIASSANNSCPFFWTVGNEDVNRKIECQLVTNGKVTILPKLQPDTVNGQPLPIGLTKFICARGDGKSTTTESVDLSCSGNPNVIER